MYKQGQTHANISYLVDPLSQTGSIIPIDQELVDLAKMLNLDVQTRSNITKHIVSCLLYVQEQIQSSQLGMIWVGYQF